MKKIISIVKGETFIKDIGIYIQLFFWVTGIWCILLFGVKVFWIYGLTLSMILVVWLLYLNGKDTK